MDLERTVKSKYVHLTEKFISGHAMVEIEVYGEEGPRGKAADKILGVNMTRESFLDMCVTLWPENVAYQFKDKND